MKTILNALGSILLVGSSTILCSKQTFENHAKDLSNYQTQSQTYSLTDNQTLYPAFYNWLNPTTASDNAWNQHFRSFNIKSNVSHITAQANNYGGIFLNLHKNSSIKEQYIDKQAKTGQAIGSFNYDSLKNSQWLKYSNLKPKPKHPPSASGPQSVPGGYKGQQVTYALHDLTPNVSMDKKISNLGVNKFITGYLNSELNYWYYSQFATQLEQTVPDYQLNYQKYQLVHNYMAHYLNNLLVFKVGGRYNSEKKVIVDGNTASQFGKDFGDLVIDGLGSLSEFAPWGWFASWFFDSMLDGIFNHVFTKWVSEDHSYTFQSDPMDLITFDNILGDILGLSNKSLPINSVIKKFINANGVYPDHLTLSNLDFSIDDYLAYTNKYTTYLWSYTPPGRIQPRVWDLYPYHHYQYNYVDTTHIAPDLSFNIQASKANPDYSQQKKVLDDPTYGSQTYPIHIYMGSAGDKIPPSDWPADNVASVLNQGWEGEGGLIPALFKYVKYNPVTIIRNKLVLCDFTLPILGFTKEHPRYFYIKGY